MYLSLFVKDKHLESLNKEVRREQNDVGYFIILAMMFVFLAGMVAGSAMHDSFFHPIEQSMKGLK